jgi:hypothetical protein
MNFFARLAAVMFYTGFFAAIAYAAGQGYDFVTHLVVSLVIVFIWYMYGEK